MQVWDEDKGEWVSALGNGPLVPNPLVRLEGESDLIDEDPPKDEDPGEDATTGEHAPVEGDVPSDESSTPTDFDVSDAPVEETVAEEPAPEAPTE